MALFVVVVIVAIVGEAERAMYMILLGTSNLNSGVVIFKDVEGNIPAARVSS